MSLTLAALFAAQALTAATPADDAALRRFKIDDWPRAYRDKDVALLNRMLADSFVVVDSGGTWTLKRDELAWLAKSEWKNDGFTYTIKRLDVYGGDTAIVAGEGLVRYATGDQPRQMRYQSTNVLIKEDGVWRAVASHVSGEKEEPLDSAPASGR